MVTLTQSLEHWLWANHREIIPLIYFGHIELLTEKMYEEYLAWCKTDEGKQYLVGGSKYDPNHASVKAMSQSTEVENE